MDEAGHHRLAPKDTVMPLAENVRTHDISVRVSKGLTDCRIVTTDEVLIELLNYFGGRARTVHL